MKAWFLLAALLAYMAEVVDVFYLFHVSLKDQVLWSQFAVGYLLYFTTSMISIRFLLPHYKNLREWMVMACFMHALLIPMFFIKLDYLFVPGLAILGLFRMDSIATLALFSIADPFELARRSFQLKIIYYIALVGASLSIFLIWVYPVLAPILGSLVHIILPVVGIVIGWCTKEQQVPIIPQQAPETPMAKCVYHLEMQLTCDFVALSTYMMVYFVHGDVVFLPLTNVVFALVCVGLVFVGYHYIRKHNVNAWYIVYVTFLFIACIVASFAFIFETDIAHPIVHLVVTIVFAMIHIAPWNVLFQLEKGFHIVAMIEHRIIGQALGFLIGLGLYQVYRVAPYLVLAALGIYATVSYENEYLKPVTNE